MNPIFRNHNTKTKNEERGKRKEEKETSEECVRRFRPAGAEGSRMPEPDEFDACFSYAAAGPGGWESFPLSFPKAILRANTKRRILRRSRLQAPQESGMSMGISL